MASLGHIAVGMAAARVTNDGERPLWRSMAAWSALSMLPDADVIPMALGVPYEHEWGHRGATHSVAFAVAVAGVVSLLAPRLGPSRARTFFIATIVIGSHALLDTLTDGGLGCALFWPFDLTRYFAPWQPIPVSPIGLDFLSLQGAFVAATELLLFCPLLLFALRSRGAVPTQASQLRRAGFIVLWLSFVWLIGSTDPVRQRVLAFLLRDRTEYAAGFSEAAFAQLNVRMTDADVHRLLGTPLENWWQYDESGQCRVVRFNGNVVARWRYFDECTPPGVSIGMTPEDVGRIAGSPPGACWGYSRSGGGPIFQARVVCIRQGRVIDIVRRWLPSEN